MLQLLDVSPLLYLLVVLSVVVSIVLHELGHAYAATAEGDPTPRMLGHLTWNPVVHMGWLSLALVAVLGIGFGRTPVTPRNFRDKRWGRVKVSFAGPAVNLALWIVCTTVLALFARVAPTAVAEARVEGVSLTLVVRWMAVLNLVLFGFNMIPLPPFDGFTVLRGFVDLGNLGLRLQSLGSIPMILAFVVVYQLDVFGWAETATKTLYEGTLILLGGG
jgi:Zn-dependent protease